MYMWWLVAKMLRKEEKQSFISLESFCRRMYFWNAVYISPLASPGCWQGKITTWPDNPLACSWQMICWWFILQWLLVVLLLQDVPHFFMSEMIRFSDIPYSIHPDIFTIDWSTLLTQRTIIALSIVGCFNHGCISSNKAWFLYPPEQSEQTWTPQKKCWTFKGWCSFATWYFSGSSR